MSGRNEDGRAGKDNDAAVAAGFLVLLTGERISAEPVGLGPFVHGGGNLWPGALAYRPCCPREGGGADAAPLFDIGVAGVTIEPAGVRGPSA